MASTRILVAIPYKPTKYLSTFNRKALKQCCVPSIPVASCLRLCSIKCNVGFLDHEAPTKRRSGNYKPALWDFNHIQSLSSEYTEEGHLERTSELKLQVKALLEEELEPLQQMELIDDLQRLGICYHFEDKINQILNRIYEQNYCKDCEAKERDLYATALQFRLFRQHGFSIPQDVFECFKNEKDCFKPSLSDGVKGLLQLYEASFMLTKGESTLELAREFATTSLKKKLDAGINDDYLAILVHDALELPIHWRIQRPNARSFFDAYRTRSDMNSIVLELAKLDFNIVQAKQQEELKEASRWWEQTSLAKKLPFARDRLVECYFWTIGVFFYPQHGYSRTMSTKVNALITVIDDIFDVYGTWEEVQLFHDAVERWDVKAIEQLPDYMQMCFLALDNVINEMAYGVLKEQGFLIIPHLRKSWGDLFRTYLQEAKWYSKEYTPKLEEYIENAWISISAPVILCHAFFLLTNPIEKRVMDQRLYEDHPIVRGSSMLLHLANDIGTSPDEMQRGDVPKLVQCYMHETNASKEEAQEYVRFLIRETWEMMNEERDLSTPFSPNFIRSALDLGRMAQYMYQYGDGHGIQRLESEIKERISHCLFEPIV